jgi:5'/3'-nucleotidase SurE
MRILISNDDGIAAPGLALLADAAHDLSEDVLIVAPERKWTAASHQLTFDRDQTLTRIDTNVYASSGAPADCVVAAMTVLHAAPALVLSGVNDKQNVGEDIAYSGTTAIAREATFSACRRSACRVSAARSRSPPTAAIWQACCACSGSAAPTGRCPAIGSASTCPTGCRRPSSRCASAATRSPAPAT